MKRYISAILIVIGLISSCFLGNQITCAAETNFSAKAILPEKQWDQKKTYFDLRVKPGEVEHLEVEVKNYTDKEITVAVQANSAVTTDGGIIDYETTNPEMDETMSHPFSEIVEVDSEVTLAPNETKKVSAKVTVPEESFNGIILGGLQFTQQKELKKKDNKNKANQTQVIGVQLSENDDPIKPEINLMTVKAGQIDGNNMILAKLQNPAPKIISNMVVTADVFKGNRTKKPLYHNRKENLNMAPNSTFDYGILTENQPFKAGKYTMKLLVEADGEKWELEEVFDIKSDEAKSFNAKMNKVAGTNHSFIYLIIGALLLIVIIGGLLFWFMRQKPQRPKRKQPRKKMKRATQRTKKPLNPKKRNPVKKKKD